MVLYFILTVLVVLMAIWIKKLLGRRWEISDKELIEDTLKHLYNSEETSIETDENTLSKVLSISTKRAARLIKKLEASGLTQNVDGKQKLTKNGRSYALKIVRVHRLLEKYFAENTSINETEWHKIAEEKEHQIDDDKARELAAQLGNPLRDPHGDPIPTAKGEIYSHNGIPLSKLEINDFGNIVHIEDEPKNLYKEISESGIYPGMQIQIKDKFEGGIEIKGDGKHQFISNEAADNISIVPLNKDEIIKQDYLPLSSLEVGEEAEVVGISKALRGMQRRRLLDFGIVPGTRIRAVLKSLGNDPVAYELRSTLIALRKNQSDYIFIRKIGKDK
ncbi:metal-dependent transcriptional regulator [Melioribacter sp. OK-6-Me]|uniref:metal-dependent transcriptional regulator n=1 Tax=unclassified Melioribacter TaxID=2627329 RepID=UPI003EDAEE0E